MNPKRPPSLWPPVVTLILLALLTQANAHCQEVMRLQPPPAITQRYDLLAVQVPQNSLRKRLGTNRKFEVSQWKLYILQTSGLPENLESAEIYLALEAAKAARVASNGSKGSKRSNAASAASSFIDPDDAFIQLDQVNGVERRNLDLFISIGAASAAAISFPGLAFISPGLMILQDQNRRKVPSIEGLKTRTLQNLRTSGRGFAWSGNIWSSYEAGRNRRIEARIER